MRTEATPRTAVKASAAATSSESASMTGATATIAELPQIELPQAINIESRLDNPQKRATRKLAQIEMTTIATTQTTSVAPALRNVPKLKEAPRRTMAISSNVLELKLMPGCQDVLPGKTVRVMIPITIAKTSASRSP